jgi:hypothetical protein
METKTLLCDLSNYAKKLKIDQSNNNIYINEALTEQHANLYYQMPQLANERKIYVRDIADTKHTCDP